MPCDLHSKSVVARQRFKPNQEWRQKTDLLSCRKLGKNEMASVSDAGSCCRQFQLLNHFNFEMKNSNSALIPMQSSGTYVRTRLHFASNEKGNPHFFLSRLWIVNKLEANITTSFTYFCWMFATHQSPFIARMAATGIARNDVDIFSLLDALVSIVPFCCHDNPINKAGKHTLAPWPTDKDKKIKMVSTENVSKRHHVLGA